MAFSPDQRRTAFGNAPLGGYLYHLRGSDAVYAAVALRFGSILITLDREQRERVAEALTARYPAEALAEIA